MVRDGSNSPKNLNTLRRIQNYTKEDVTMVRFQTGTASVGNEDRSVHVATARTADNVE